MEAIRTNNKKKVPVIAVDEEELRTHVSEVVRQSVEETLNGLLDAEADTLCQARRYERNAERVVSRIFRTFCSSQSVKHGFVSSLESSDLSRYFLVHVHIPLRAPLLPSHIA